jgi:hypothetical protein
MFGHILVAYVSIGVLFMIPLWLYNWTNWHEDCNHNPVLMYITPFMWPFILLGALDDYRKRYWRARMLLADSRSPSLPPHSKDWYLAACIRIGVARTCTGKGRFQFEGLALDVRKLAEETTGSRSVVHYPCPFCNNWHVALKEIFMEAGEPK